MKGIIAEIGNNHFGDFALAKRMISECHKAGAHYIKLQAIDPNIVCAIGSMPKEFYEKCAFTEDQYNELIHYGRSIGAKVFYSVFGDFNLNHDYYKISAYQFLSWPKEKLKEYNNANTVISVPDRTTKRLIHEKYKAIENMNIMIASNYFSSCVDVELVAHLWLKVGKAIGYSDHSVGIRRCIQLIQDRTSLIEKHVHLFDIKNSNDDFRDVVHSINEKELWVLTKLFNEVNK